MQRRRDVVGLHREQSENMPNDVHAKQDRRFGLRRNPGFAQRRNECDDIYANGNDHRHGRIVGKYPGNDPAERKQQEKSIRSGDLLESILQREQKNHERKDLCRRGRQRADAGSACNLPKKDDSGYDRPDKPCIGVRVDPAF